MKLKSSFLRSKDFVGLRRYYLPWKVSQGQTLKNSVVAVAINIIIAEKF
jgi:hypothetical protein